MKSETNRDFLMCLTHPTKLAKRLCGACDTFICNACAVDSHSGHIDQLKSLNSLYLNSSGQDTLKKALVLAENNHKLVSSKNSAASLKFKCMYFVFHEGKYFCKQCKKYICEKCLSNHQKQNENTPITHVTMPLNTYFEFLKNKIEFFLQLMTTNKPSALVSQVEYDSNKILSNISSKFDIEIIAKFFDLKNNVIQILNQRKNIQLYLLHEINEFYSVNENLILKNESKFQDLQKVYDKLKFEKDLTKVYDHFIDFENFIDNMINIADFERIQNSIANFGQFDKVLNNYGNYLQESLNQKLIDDLMSKYENLLRDNESRFRLETMNALMLDEELYEKFKQERQIISKYDREDIVEVIDAVSKEKEKDLEKVEVKEVIKYRTEFNVDDLKVEGLGCFEYFGVSKNKGKHICEETENIIKEKNEVAQLKEIPIENTVETITKKNEEVKEVFPVKEVLPVKEEVNTIQPVKKEEIETLKINEEVIEPLPTIETNKIDNNEAYNFYEKRITEVSHIDRNFQNDLISVYSNNKEIEVLSFEMTNKNDIPNTHMDDFFNSDPNELDSNQEEEEETISTKVEIISLGYNCQSTFIFNPLENTVKELEFSHFKFPAFHSFLNILPWVYLSGGKDKANKELNSFYKIRRIDEKNFVYFELAPLIEKRSFHTMVHYAQENCIFAISGSRNKSCEKYDIEKDNWTVLPSLNTSREKLSACIHNNQFLYVFLGFDRTINKFVNNIERLNLQSEIQWEVLSVKGNQNLMKKQAMSCFYSKESVLLIGGVNALRNETKEVLLYDFNNNTITLQKILMNGNHSFNHGEFISLGNQHIFYNFSENFEIVKFNPVQMMFI